MSPVTATGHLLNLKMISIRSGSRHGPISRQSFKETPFGPHDEASKTGRTFVVVLLSFTTGL